MSSENPARDAIEVFEPDPAVVYSLATAAQLANVSRRNILVYCRHGLVVPVGDPALGGYYFSAETIDTLKRIESLRTICGDDFAGIRVILALMAEVRRLRAAGI